MNRIMYVASLLAFASLMAGCASSATDFADEDDSVEIASFDDVREEYSRTVDSLAWPEGYETRGEIELDDTVQYEKGWGVVMASYQWECAWEGEWLDSYASDSVRADAALAELEKATSMEYQSDEYADESTQEAFASKLEKARLGDPSEIANDVEVNCG